MLCDPISDNGPRAILYAETLPSGKVFVIQHFSVEEDIQELQRQFLDRTRGWDLDGLIEQFKSSFHYIAGSHTSQAFVASLDGVYVFEIEVHQATAHQTQLDGVDIVDGDFILQIAGGDYSRFSHEEYADALACSCRYFLTFIEVQRLLINAQLTQQYLDAAFFNRASFNLLKNATDIYQRLKQPLF